jgi:hypothetical protein
MEFYRDPYMIDNGVDPIINIDVEEDSNQKELIEQDLDSQSDDTQLDEFISNLKEPEPMPSLSSFEDTFKLSIEDINIRYHIPKIFNFFDKPYKRIEASIYVRPTNNPYTFLWYKKVDDLHKVTSGRNWNKLRKEANKFCWNYYEEMKSQYQEQLREWWFKRKETNEKK